MADEIVNKVAQSGLVTLDLSNHIPDLEKAELDIEQFLFKGLILREKEFREQVKNFSWESYKHKAVAVFCSTDAIIPHWAFMLISTSLKPHADLVVYGTKETLDTVIARESVQKIDPQAYAGQRVVVKGCGDEKVTVAAYLEVTQLLEPVVKSLMYGEPCSTVPIYKKKV